MIQDQNAQTTNSHDNIIEQVNEQEFNGEELHDITGGCLWCGVLSTVTTLDGAKSIAIGRVFGDAGHIRKGAAQLAIGGDSAHSFGRNPGQGTPCKNCLVNGVLYAATKAM